MRRRTIVRAALGTVAIAAAVLLWSWKRGQDEREQAATEAQAVAARAETRAPSTPSRRPQRARPMREEAPSTPAPGAAPAPSAPSPAEASAVRTLVQRDKPLQPPVREHAKQIIIPTIVRAIGRRDVSNLNSVLQLAKEHTKDQLLSEADVGALEAAIACLERAPDAEEEAADLLRFGAATPLADGVRSACALR